MYACMYLCMEIVNQKVGSKLLWRYMMITMRLKHDNNSDDDHDISEV